ncbi:alcohol dehydrogenase [Halomicrobium zhouii]|uniref:Alcohol dehydrogenase n=1 Tax=Halomicrobium zhouii TaxID=767519 RepID=A0A1I6KYV9_9EURY|nr:iron-containing alcohol dehydrogenase family protein [Halomicrobium zhouii]SFR96412.1 alcohol dehydrogenase [Halomicrobium zhouii]
MSPVGSHRDGDDPFRFEYDPAVLRYGVDAVADLSDELDAHDVERALVVCGSTVGNTPAVIDPVRDGLGDRLGGVFAETTPAKTLSTAYDAMEAMEAADADVLVSLGGGSSLDVAKVTSVLAVDDREPQAVGRELAETGTVSIPDGSLAPIVAVPTTLAGADLSMVAGVTASPDEERGLVDRQVSGGIGDPRLMPRAVVYDPALVATTPRNVLAGSAMNGFDKGIETLYAGKATPITDATAARGLGLMQAGLLRLGEEGVNTDVLKPVLKGLLLVQYGISRPGDGTLSLIHAFGHGLTRTYAVQQGHAHAVVAPHVLRYLFEQVEGRRDLLADALGAGDADDPAAAVVERVTAVRGALDLPTRLRDVDGPDREEFPAVAEDILADSFVANGPADLDPTAEEIERVLDDAW